MLSKLLAPTTSTQYAETKTQLKEVYQITFDLEEVRQNVLLNIDGLALDAIYKQQLKQLKNAHHQLDDLVTQAYIGEHFGRQTSMVFPIDLIYIIDRYWSDYDVFDSNEYDDTCYIHNTSSDFRAIDTVLGSTIITNNNRKVWEIAVIKPLGGIYIGVVDISNETGQRPFCFSPGGYGVCSSSGHFYGGHKKDRIKKHYIQPFDDDDVEGKAVVIGVDLNLIDGTLSFRFDDMICQTAYKFDAEQRKKSYRLAVAVPGGTAVYLIK